MSRDDLTNLAYWFPKVEAAGLRVPRTEIVETDADLLALLDGETPEGWDEFIDAMRRAAARIGWPLFLRTGHGSGKHEWARTCHVPAVANLSGHIAALVEWSALADMFGLPTRTWALRELIPTVPLCRCLRFDGFPVTREFRFFVRDGLVVHAQPYWPPDSVEQGRPDADDWRERLAQASKLTALEYGQLVWIAGAAGEAVGGGYWSVDLLQAADGEWWLTDMAEGDRSFRWEPEAA